MDTAGKTKPMYGRGRGFRGRGGFRGRWNNFNNRNQQANTNTLQTLTKAQKIKERDRQRQVRKWQKQQAGRQNYHRAAPIKSREASVTVKSDWIVVEEMDFPRLAKSGKAYPNRRLSKQNVKDDVAGIMYNCFQTPRTVHRIEMRPHM